MKKSFSNTAAAAFITAPTEAKPKTAPAISAAPAAAGGEQTEMLVMYRKPKCNPGEEARTLRKQLLMRPSVFNAINAYAQGHRLSFNSIAELAIEYYMQTHTKTGTPRR